MSQQDPTPGSSTAFASPKEAKAHAQAAKAYRKASRPWFKKKRFWALGLILLIVLISLFSGGGSDDSTANSASTENNEATDTQQEVAPPAFAGAESTDVVGQAGEQLTLGEVAVTSEALFEGDATLGPTLCTPVSVSNNSEETIDFNGFDWKLQAPGGTILNSGFVGSDNQLSGGQIAPGGSTSGDVCFDADNPETGQYVVLYEPIFSFFSDRGAWINNR